jgi:hypothetical protein
MSAKRYLAMVVIALVMVSSVVPIANPTTAQESTFPPVLWLQNDQLWLNDTPLIDANVLTASLSPDGSRIAYLTIPDETQPMTLVLYDIASATPLATLSAEALPPFEDFALQFAQPHWVDNTTVIFTTLAALGGPGGVFPLADMWRFGSSGTSEQLRERGAGGYITLSPDRNRVALVRAGEYQDPEQLAVVEIVDTTTFGPLTEPYAFPAVASGTEIPYIPPVRWSADGATLAFAVPDPDLVYTPLDNDAPVTSQLCQMTTADVQCESVVLGFPARPVWSADLARVAYHREVAINTWEMVVQRGDAQTVLPPTTSLPEPLLWASDDLLLREVTLNGAVYYWVTGDAQIVWEQPILGVQQLDETRIALAVGSPETYTIQVYDRATDTFTEISTQTEGFPRFVGR